MHHSWEEVEAALLYHGGKIVVFKSQIPPPNREYHTTKLGLRNGAMKQYEKVVGDTRVHVREYENYYEAHVDRTAPTKDPIGHLKNDSPLYFFALDQITRFALTLWK